MARYPPRPYVGKEPSFAKHLDNQVNLMRQIVIKPCIKKANHALHIVLLFCSFADPFSLVPHFSFPFPVHRFSPVPRFLSLRFFPGSFPSLRSRIPVPGFGLIICIINVEKEFILLKGKKNEELK